VYPGYLVALSNELNSDPMETRHPNSLVNHYQRCADCGPGRRFAEFFGSADWQWMKIGRHGLVWILFLDECIIFLTSAEALSKP